MIGLNKKIYASLIVFSLLILAFMIFIIYPVFTDIKENSQNFVSQRNTFAELQIRSENFKELEKFYQTHQMELEKINTLFIDSETPIEFMEFLEKNASNFQLSIKISDVSSKKLESELWNSSNYQLVISGSFPNILKFLEKLENSPYLIEISNLNVKKLTERDIGYAGIGYSVGDVWADLVIKVYTK